MEIVQKATSALKGMKDKDSPPPPPDGESFGLVQLLALVFSLSLGLTALIIVSFAAERRWLEAFGILGLLAMAALSAGTFFGFLFGVPRTAIVDTAERYRANTNVEKISDWLTTALVGATLVQLGSISKGLGVLFDSVAEQVGARIGPIVPGSIVVYFAILGFFLGWLVTRLYLHRAMKNADSKASIREKLVEVQSEMKAAVAEGDDEKAAALREELAKLEGTLRMLGDEYKSIRATVPPGNARTAQLRALVKEMKKSAANPVWTRAAVRDVYEQGEEGRIRALALMQGRPDLADPDLLQTSIGHSMSAFEQHSALTATHGAAGKLDDASKFAIAAEIRTQMRPGGFILPESDRYPLALGVLKLIE